MATIPGLSVTPAAWWQARDAATIELDASGNVRKMLDKSGNGRNLFVSDASAAKRPKYNASDARIGGRPSISATAANQVLITASDNNGTPTSLSFEVREIWIFAQYATGVETQFNVANNMAGWGSGSVAGGNDGYSTLIGGSVNGVSGGNPRFMGNLNTGRVIGSSSLDPDGAYKNRDTFKSGSGNTAMPALLPLPLSVLQIVPTTTAVNAVRFIGNMDTGANRAHSGPWTECAMFEFQLSEADRAVMRSYGMREIGAETAPGPITGTASAKLGTLVSASAGRLSIKALAAKSLGLLKGSATGSLALRGVVSKTLGVLTSSSAGRLALRGQSAGRLGSLSSSSAGRLSIKGSASQVLGSLVGTAEGATSEPEPIEGQTTARLGDLQGVAAGRLALAGQAVSQLGALRGTSQGELLPINEGGLAATLGTLRGSATGTLQIRGQTAAKLGTLAASGQGVLPIEGRLVSRLGALISQAAGRFFDKMVPAIRVVRAEAQSRVVLAFVQKRVAVASETNRMLTWPPKDPDERLDYQIDWTARLAGDTISSSTWIVPEEMTVTSESFEDAKTTIWLSGGVPSRSIEIVNRVETVGGRIWDQSVSLRIVRK